MANSSRQLGWADLLDEFKPFPASQAAQPATAHSSTKLGWANLSDKYMGLPCELGSAAEPLVDKIGLGKSF